VNDDVEDKGINTDGINGAGLETVYADLFKDADFTPRLSCSGTGRLSKDFLLRDMTEIMVDEWFCLF